MHHRSIKQSNRPVIRHSFTHDFFLLVNEGSHVAYVAFLIAVTPSDKLRLGLFLQVSLVTFVKMVNIVTSPKACFRTKKTPTNQAMYIVERHAFCGRLVKNYELRR